MKSITKVIFTILCIVMTTACNATTKKQNQDLATIETRIETKSKSKKPTIKVALLLDTSNSMDGLIDQAKAQLWEIVNELSYAKCKEESPNLKIALYEYGNDNLNADEAILGRLLHLVMIWMKYLNLYSH